LALRTPVILPRCELQPIWNNPMSNRREFFVQLSLVSGALVSGQALAQTAMVDEKDATAAALGYKADTAKVDGAKFPKHAATQTCSNCALYQGKTGDAAGACPLFAGKQVAAKGWCSAWAKKA